MSMPRPHLFRGKTQDLKTKIEMELRDPNGLGWQGQPGGAGKAMVGLFERYADIIIARLNQVPQQHFLVFLSEGGIDQLPPRAATTQLAFVPENDARPVIPVPAGTQVATRASADQPENVFETAHAIQVIPTELKWCIALDQRTSADRTNKANGLEPGAFVAFQGEDVRERVLYIRHELLTFTDPVTRTNATVTLQFELDPGVQSADAWTPEWSYFDGKEWATLAKAGAEVADGTDHLTRSGDICFTRLPELAETDINGDKGRWLACQLKPVRDEVTLPRINEITIRRVIEVEEQQVDPLVFSVSQAGAAFAQVKPADGFYPFGQYPALLDGLYIQANEAFTKPGATIELAFKGDGLPAEIGNTSKLEELKVVWEYFSTDGWTRLGESQWGCPEMAFADRNGPLVKNIEVHTRAQGRQVEIELPPDYAGEEPPPGFPPGRVDVFGDRPFFVTALPQACADLPVPIIERGRSYTSKRLNFCDNTCAFTAKTTTEDTAKDVTKSRGIVSFTVPPSAGGSDPAFAETEVNGQKGNWIRAYIEKDGYSEQPAARAGLLQKLLLGKIPAPPPKAIPPLVRSFEARYVNYRPAEEARPVQNCYGKTDGGWSKLVAGQGFEPFSASTVDPALYLGFLPLDTDQAKGRVAFPANTWIELYFGIEETNDERRPSKLQWEYWDGQWRALGIVDETRNFSRSGSVGFFGPPGHKHSLEFGRDAYWLRVCESTAVADNRRDKGGATGTNAPPALPRIAAIRLNVVPGNNGESLNDEVVGSSNGEKNQIFMLSRAPVLPDIQIEVREQDENTEAADQTWIAWERVPNLLSRGPTDRCYTLDPTSGTIAFGDGKHGMIPLAGQDNIRVTRYHTHSGKNGNVGAGSVIVLRSPRDALNEIRRVGNVEAATGGADLEETANVELRGPYSLKNRGRAITGQDFEWLAREVTGVRHVYCLPASKAEGTREPGWVTVVVVPAPTHTLSDANGRPIPVPSLLRQVREYLEARGLVNLARSHGDIGDGVTASATEDPNQVQVTGPGFVEVEVVAQVVARSPEQADSVRTDILKQLRTFLDPADGGPDRMGWQPGRDVYISEVKAEIENVPGVDHVKFAYLRTPGRQLQFLTLNGEENLVAEIPRGSMVSTFDRRIMAVLADDLPEGNPAREIRVSSFGDGDMATIWGLHGPALPSMYRVSVQHDNPARIVFGQPADFSNESKFAKWRCELGDEPALVSANRRVRMPIRLDKLQDHTVTDATGRIHLMGVEVRGFQEREAVSITHAEHINRRVEPLEVTRASPLDPSSSINKTANERELPVVFVPPDHLVFSGNHDIEMVV
jgi:uncharacterized phage protein gp47/JayE